MTFKVAVASPSFSRNDILRTELAELGLPARFAPDEKVLGGPDLCAFLQGATLAIVGTEVIGPEVLQHCPDLRVISKYGVGTDNLSEDAISEAGVRLYTHPGSNASSVAETALGFMLCALHNIFFTNQQMREGKWLKRGGRMLQGRVVGLLGFGYTAQALARLLKPFDCHILYCDILDKSTEAKLLQAQPVNFTDLCKQAEILSLHVPLTDLTKGMLNHQAISLMQPHSILINTARGELLHMPALKAALLSGRLSQVCMDVYAQEPFLDQDWIRMPGVTTTPHIAGNSLEAVLAMGRAAIQGIADGLAWLNAKDRI